MFVAIAGAAQARASPMTPIIKYRFMPFLCFFGISSSMNNALIV